MNKTFLSLMLTASLAACSTVQAETAPSTEKWQPRIDFEGKLGNQRSLGEADLLIPLWQNNDSLLFANLRGRMDNDDSYEGNIGVGFRHMLDNGWNLGGYGYFDRRKSPYDNFFNQVTIGVEALSMDWDLRANAYIPVGETSYFEESLGTADFSGTAITYRAGEERSMSGYDAEIGWRIPVFTPEDDKQLRIYAGGYRFTDSRADTIQGPRARLEMKFNALPFLSRGSRLSLGLEYQHDDPRGSQRFAMLRLSIPLGGTKARSGRALTAMEQRMTDPVVRDVDVVSQAGSYGSPEKIRETADGKRIVLFDDSVNGNNFSTAIANAGENTTVILNGDYTGVNTLTTVQQGQQILGSANLKVKTPSGRSVNITTPSASLSGAGISGSGSGANRFFDMADNSSLIGVKAKITNSSSSIIARIEGKDNVKILNNTLTSEVSISTAAILDVRSSRNVTIRNNNINVIANGSSAHVISFVDNNANIDFSNNSLNIGGTAATLRTYLLSGVTINNLSGTGNTSNLVTCYIVGAYTITGSIETNGNISCP
ncbi:inverse autotransporter beta domain-containing protein [Methylophaga sp. OBS1]|uniref:inverse autotransporter beta domain-containing protein n=1 Tax=Methylophaga sp. OBS1 TaxID=2991933 RepID=UPI00224C96C8|nr:inverse autotransporter beta domain-containing protein [Methylophaga sp. OBS1]MCX4192464.1 inverse autotransporter beta domain-containing protein [Methylophaga sp. OBS1]